MTDGQVGRKGRENGLERRWGREGGESHGGGKGGKRGKERSCRINKGEDQAALYTARVLSPRLTNPTASPILQAFSSCSVLLPALKGDHWFNISADTLVGVDYAAGANATPHLHFKSHSDHALKANPVAARGRNAWGRRICSKFRMGLSGVNSECG